MKNAYHVIDNNIYAYYFPLKWIYTDIWFDNWSFKAEGAEIHIGGANWNEANEEAQRYLSKEPDAFFVHPFNQKSTWQGHSTIIDEIKSQLKEKFQEHRQPAAIITVAGGGGLAIGKHG